MVTASTAVSPRVVAAIFMIQKPSVTAGTLLRGSSSFLFTMDSSSRIENVGATMRDGVTISILGAGKPAGELRLVRFHIARWQHWLSIRIIERRERVTARAGVACARSVVEM